MYILADVLQVRGLKDRIVEALVSTYGKISKERGLSTIPFWRNSFERPEWMPCPARSINWAWEVLSKGCHLRRLLLLLFCDNVQDLAPKHGEEHLSPEFQGAAYRVVTGRWRYASGSSQWDKGIVCNFHDHDIGHPNCLVSYWKDHEIPDHAWLESKDD